MTLAIIHRFHQRSVTENVVQHARKMTNAELSAEFRPGDDVGGEDRPGEFAVIVTPGVDIWATQKLSECVDMALNQALAEALDRPAYEHPDGPQRFDI